MTGRLSSTPATKTVTVAAVNDAPVVTTSGGSTAFTEDGGPVAVDAALTATDVDNANLVSAAVTITNPQDGALETLATTACGGLSVTPGLNTLSIAGTQPKATYQTCLQSVTFDDSSNDPGTTPRVVSFVVDDGALGSTPATKTVTVTAVNDAPVVTTTATTTPFTEDGGAVVVDGGVTVSDVDDTNLASATVTITNPQDGAAETLAATGCPGLTTTPSLNTLSITGSQSLATYQSCLQSVTYDNSSQDPGTTSRTISFVANDGTSSSAPASKTVSVTAVNDAPTVTTSGGTVTFTEDQPAVAVDSGVVVADVDNANLASATVTITNPQDGAAETLGATSCGGLDGDPGAQQPGDQRQPAGGHLPDLPALGGLRQQLAEPRRLPQPHRQLRRQRRRPGEHAGDEAGGGDPGQRPAGPHQRPDHLRHRRQHPAARGRARCWPAWPRSPIPRACSPRQAPSPTPTVRRRRRR